jgi:hypothetical protein
MLRPKYRPGDVLGDLTFVQVLGHSDTCEGRHLSQKRWWYRVRCTCGIVEIASQSSLNRKRSCQVCANRQRGLTQRKKQQPKSDIPDFARIKL